MGGATTASCCTSPTSRPLVARDGLERRVGKGRSMHRKRAPNNEGERENDPRVAYLTRWSTEQEYRVTHTARLRGTDCCR